MCQLACKTPPFQREFLRSLEVLRVFPPLLDCRLISSKICLATPQQLGCRGRLHRPDFPDAPRGSTRTMSVPLRPFPHTMAGRGISEGRRAAQRPREFLSGGYQGFLKQSAAGFSKAVLFEWHYMKGSWSSLGMASLSPSRLGAQAYMKASGQ